MNVIKRLSPLFTTQSKVILCMFLLYACVEDVDFNQPTDITLTPVLESSLVFLEVESSRFVTNGIETFTVTDAVSNIEVFDEDFVNDNLERVELTFEVGNSINRSFELQILFLDINNQLQRDISFTIAPSSTGDVVLTEHIEVFDEASIQQLKNTYTIAFVFTMPPSSDGSVLDENSAQRIELDSKGTFYFRIES